jgi:hypothetical protein
MTPSRYLTCAIEGFPSAAALFCATVLPVALIACSPQPQNPPATLAAAPANFQASEQCSMFGRLACEAMAMMSSDNVPTCSATRARNGTRIETCGSVPITPKPAEPTRVNLTTYPVRLAWSDNSDNESQFIIERCDQINIGPQGENKSASCAGAWRSIGSVGSNTTIYVDNTAAFNQMYIYRVKAINSKGSSGYTQEAVITTPAP